MKTATILALHAINRRFYASSTAREFSDTRDHFWPGWAPVVGALPDDTSNRSVLDIGCGNGRFAAYLGTQWGNDFSYLGIDLSEPLLEVARGRTRGLKEISFLNADFSILCTDPRVCPGPFSLIATFGVMHHLPSFEKRRSLLSALLARLQPHGRLAVTFWRFGGLERFKRKVLSWNEYNLSAAQPIDTDDLEEGDYLLRWGKGGDTSRYCHFANDKEIEALINALKITGIESYLSDGEDNAFNQYLVIST
jgi:SAM-dependent methyltransferase